MRLLTNELRKRLPRLCETEDIESCEEMIAQVKFYSPDSGWSLYVIEFDGEDIFFGFAEGLVERFGYFSLKELEKTGGPRGERFERDLYFEPTPIREIRGGGKAVIPKEET